MKVRTLELKMEVTSSEDQRTRLQSELVFARDTDESIAQTVRYPNYCTVQHKNIEKMRIVEEDAV